MDDAAGMQVAEGTGNFGDPKPHCFFGKCLAVDMES